MVSFWLKPFKPPTFTYVCKNHAREINSILAQRQYIPIWNFDMVSFWLKLFKPPATLKVFPSIYFCLAANRRLAQLMFATKHNHDEHNQHNQ